MVQPTAPSPKLVVMKVLCKLRWKKIRHPLISPLTLSIFIHSLFIPLPVSVFLFIFSSALSIFLTRCVFLSVSHCYSLFHSFPLSVCLSSVSLSVSSYPSFSPSLLIALLPLHSLFPFHARLLCLFTKINLSLICCVLLSFSLFHSFFKIVFSHESVCVPT